MRYVALVLAALATTSLLSAQSSQDRTAALAQRTKQLGECNVELGQLQQLQAAVIGGQLLTSETFRVKFEQANTGKTLNENLVIMDKR